MKNLLMALLIVMMAAGLAMAQEMPQDSIAVEDDTFTLSTVNGEISGITKKGISVIYDKDYDSGTEYEMMILINDKTKLKHKTDFSELKTGDLVSIEFEKPGEKSKHKTMAVTITFIQSGVANLMSEDKKSLTSEEDATS